MSNAEEWRAFGEERARWPLGDVALDLSQRAPVGVTVRGIGMEALSYLAKQLLDRVPELSARPLVVVTPTEEEALRLGQNMRACLSGCGIKCIRNEFSIAAMRRAQGSDETPASTGVSSTPEE